MAKKQNEKWVDAIGGEIRDLLITHQGRRFEYHQAGPYTTHKTLPIDIYFNENKSGATFSRFGYLLNSKLLEPEDLESRVLYAGFELFDVAVVVNRFLPNLQANLNTVANQLGEWLQDQKSPIFRFAQQDGKTFVWRRSIAVRHLPTELALYGDMKRKSTGVTDQPGLIAGTRFLVLRPLFDFGRMSDGQIKVDAAKIAEAVVSVFDELSFLYELLLLPGEKLKSRQVPSPAIGSKEVESPISPTPEKQVCEEGASNPIPFEADSLQDERTRVFANVVQRQGQGDFRDSLLKAYKHQCAVTECGVVDVLQAAHIKPYTGEKSNHVTNGLLLRADIHNLFDLHFLSIDPKTNKIELAPSLLGSQYGKFHGMRLRLPNDSSKRPDAKALGYHYSLRRKK